MLAFTAELLRFLRHRKKMWLAPIIFIFVIFGLLLLSAQTSVFGPFVYTLF